MLNTSKLTVIQKSYNLFIHKVSATMTSWIGCIVLFYSFKSHPNTEPFADAFHKPLLLWVLMCYLLKAPCFFNEFFAHI